MAMYLDGDERGNHPEGYASSAHEAGIARVALVTHRSNDGKLHTKVWVGAAHSLEGGTRLLADIDMETGEVKGP